MTGGRGELWRELRLVRTPGEGSYSRNPAASRPSVETRSDFSDHRESVGPQLLVAVVDLLDPPPRCAGSALYGLRLVKDLGQTVEVR